jgi:hypothetical protein
MVELPRDTSYDPETRFGVRIIHVDEQTPSDIHKQDRILNVIGNTKYFDPFRKLDPAAVRKRFDVITLGFQIVPDPMVWKQNRQMSQAPDRLRVQVVGMAMRKPYVFGSVNVGPFGGGNPMGEAPAAEKRIILIAEPRVRG